VYLAALVIEPESVGRTVEAVERHPALNATVGIDGEVGRLTELGDERSVTALGHSTLAGELFEVRPEGVSVGWLDGGTAVCARSNVHVLSDAPEPL